jgi:hypothetical protein
MSSSDGPDEDVSDASVRAAVPIRRFLAMGALLSFVLGALAAVTVLLIGSGERLSLTIAIVSAVFFGGLMFVSAVSGRLGAKMPKETVAGSFNVLGLGAAVARAWRFEILLLASASVVIASFGWRGAALVTGIAWGNAAALFAAGLVTGRRAASESTFVSIGTGWLPRFEYLTR